MAESSVVQHDMAFWPNKFRCLRCTELALWTKKWEDQPGSLPTIERDGQHGFRNLWPEFVGISKSLKKQRNKCMRPTSYGKTKKVGMSSGRDWERFGL